MFCWHKVLEYWTELDKVSKVKCTFNGTYTFDVTEAKRLYFGVFVRYNAFQVHLGLWNAAHLDLIACVFACLAVLLRYWAPLGQWTPQHGLKNTSQRTTRSTWGRAWQRSMEDRQLKSSVHSKMSPGSDMNGQRVRSRLGKTPVFILFTHTYSNAAPDSLVREQKSRVGRGEVGDGSYMDKNGRKTCSHFVTGKAHLLPSLQPQLLKNVFICYTQRNLTWYKYNIIKNQIWAHLCLDFEKPHFLS